MAETKTARPKPSNTAHLEVRSLMAFEDLFCGRAFCPRRRWMPPAPFLISRAAVVLPASLAGKVKQRADADAAAPERPPGRSQVALDVLLRLVRRARPVVE